jgi:hypothetical protein
MISYRTKTIKIQVSQDAAYAAAPRAQFLEDDCPAVGRGNLLALNAK